MIVTKNFMLSLSSWVVGTADEETIREWARGLALE